MLALTVKPRTPGSLAVLEVPDPEPGPGELLVDGLALGVCGTDVEISLGDYGTAPEGRERLVLGHESFGRVRTAPEGSGFNVGDLVVGVVRRPDPEPCPACAQGEFDMCRNNRYTERGIEGRDGFASQMWSIEAGYAVALDPALSQVGVLIEPTTVVAKAWEQIELINARAWQHPERLLVTGAGPIGLLAALLGAARGLQVHVLDRATAGAKPRMVDALGGEYHTGEIAEVAAKVKPDIIIEATGSPEVAMSVVNTVTPAGIVCMTSVTPIGHNVEIDAGTLNRELVLENRVVFGTVNANLRHYRAAASALAAADTAWLEQLITRRVPLAEAEKAFERDADDIKVVIEL
jgi:threonine dehydrogenase-like Zn-dependent dehydrogenase